MAIINGVQHEPFEEREAREHAALVLRELADRVVAGEGESIEWEWLNDLTPIVRGPHEPQPRRQLGEKLTFRIGYGPSGRPTGSGSVR